MHLSFKGSIGWVGHHGITKIKKILRSKYYLEIANSSPKEKKRTHLDENSCKQWEIDEDFKLDYCRDLSSASTVQHINQLVLIMRHLNAICFVFLCETLWNEDIIHKFF